MVVDIYRNIMYGGTSDVTGSDVTQRSGAETLSLVDHYS